MNRPDEDDLLRSVAIRNAQSILAARQRAEAEVLQAKEELAHSLAIMRATLDSTWDGILVTDSTGAVLPGVMVEAAGSALIEGSRGAVTDGDGRYLIVELRPGPYRVTFTLTGFATIIREWIQLPADFTATVNMQMQVGDLN